jgi:N-acetylglucosamine-6-sulfatase
MGEQDDRPREMFDFWMSHKGQGNYWDNEFNINGQLETRRGYYTTVVTEAAIEWLKRPHDKPWLLILGHKAPHGGPIVPDKKYEHAFDQTELSKPKNADNYRAADGKPKWLEAQYTTWHGGGGPLYNNHDYGKFVRAYFGTIASIDDSMGQLYETLRKAGTLDSTLIIFTSDNGFALGEHGRVDKRTMYEESIRVPLLVRYPRLIPKPCVVTGSVLSLDLAPSILEVCSAAPLEGIDGRSWRPLLAGEVKGWERPWLYEYNYEPEFPYTPNVRGVRSGDWKLIRYPHGDQSDDRYALELYDLKSDPLEMHNLAGDVDTAPMRRKLAKQLQQLFELYPQSVDDMPLDEGIKQTLPRF